MISRHYQLLSKINNINESKNNTNDEIIFEINNDIEIITKKIKMR
jgi:hypothetical protein